MPPKKRGGGAAPARSSSKRAKSDAVAAAPGVLAAPDVAAAPEALVYWLGDSTISFLTCDGGKKKKAGTIDQCAAAWQALHEALPSINLGEPGAHLTESVGGAKALTKHVDHLVQDARSTAPKPKPRAFVISAGYNNLKDGSRSIVDTLTAQVDRLHAQFPDVPVLLLGLAVSHNGADGVIEAAQQVTASLTALLHEQGVAGSAQSPRRSGWLTLLHPDAWIEREADFPYYAKDTPACPFPHWEDEEKANGGSLHLSIRSRVRQLGIIEGALRTLLPCGDTPPTSGESAAATGPAQEAPLETYIQRARLTAAAAESLA